MVDATTILVETEVVKTSGGGRVRLVLRWRDTGSTCRIQAETFRAAATVCERSGDERWVVDANNSCAFVGRGLLATLVTVELAEGDAGEVKRATALLAKLAREMKR